MKNETLKPGEWAIASDPNDPDNTEHIVFRALDDEGRTFSICLTSTLCWLTRADLAAIKEEVQQTTGYENYTVRRATREEAISYL